MVPLGVTFGRKGTGLAVHFGIHWASQITEMEAIKEPFTVPLGGSFTIAGPPYRYARGTLEELLQKERI